MLRTTIKRQKKLKEKILNKNTKFRNINKSNIKKSNSLNKPTLKEKIDLVGPKTSTFLYNMKKRQQLNTLKEKTHKVTLFMNKLGESFKNFNKNLNSASNPLMISNLSKINFKRSLYIRNQLRNIDKMNREFDREYNPFNLNSDNKYNYNGYEIKELDEEYKDRIKKEKKIRDEKFRTESNKILNLLFKNDDIQEEVTISDYKKNKKLNELKSNIDYVCGVEQKGKNIKNQNDSGKIPHYTIPAKNPSFIREKTKNISFTPSVRYNKTKVYFCKKYELSQEKIDKSKKLLERLNIKVSPDKLNTIKKRNLIIKTNQNKFSSNYIISPIKKFNHKEINNEKSIILNTDINENKGVNVDENKNSDNCNNDNLPEINSKEYNNNIFKTEPNRKNKIVTFSPKLRHSNYEQNLILPKNTFASKELNKRCKTASYKSYLTNDFNDVNSCRVSKGKKIYPILKNLLNDNYNLKSDLKLGFNIITNMINDFKSVPKKKVPKYEVNIEELRKDLRLHNLGNIVDEVDVVMNNVKRMEKLVKKKDIYFLRKVAKTVIREDKLANKNLVFNNNTINAKLKKIYDRRVKTNNQDENENENLEKQHRIEMIKLFKNDGPDFFSETYLANLIKRYKTMKIK